MEYLKKLWNENCNNNFEIILSESMLLEISRCSEPKRTILLDYLNQIDYFESKLNDEIGIIADEYLINEIIPMKYKEDAQHIAIATFNNCNAVVSWNFSHRVKLKTILGVNGINQSINQSIGSSDI